MNIHTHAADGILQVTLDRPPANAIDASLSRRLGDIFADFRDNPQMRVAIISGAGTRFFCAGWDLKAAAAGESPNADFGQGGFGGYQDLPNLTKPVIAAVNGMAVGGGLELVLAADIVVAAPHAVFFTPGVTLGVLSTTAATLLGQRIPVNIANEMLLTGSRLDAQRAYELGLVNHVTQDPTAHARSIAQAITDASQEVQQAIFELRGYADAPVNASSLADMPATRKLLDATTLGTSMNPSETSHHRTASAAAEKESAPTVTNSGSGTGLPERR
jgi:crotonobetainyl-CoA hydratase